jgi:vancomycin aglycone glucosyltransferase
VVGGGPEFAASSAAEHNRVAYRYVVYCPAMFPSRDHAPIFVPWQSLPGWANRALWPLVMTPIQVAIGRVLTPARRSVGLAPVRDAMGLLLGGGCSPSTRCSRVHREASPIAQFPALHPLGGEALPAKLGSFLDAGPAPVYFGFGSMPDARPQATTRILLEAIETLGCRAVIGAGWAELGGAALPEGVLEIGSVSHPELFARCAAVHHGAPAPPRRRPQRCTSSGAAPGRPVLLGAARRSARSGRASDPAESARRAGPDRGAGGDA